MNCSLLLVLCLTIHLAYGASVEKRNVLDLLNPFKHFQKSVVNAVQSGDKPSVNFHLYLVHNVRLTRLNSVKYQNLGCLANHAESLWGFTPFVNTTITLSKHAKCVSSANNQLTGLSLDLIRRGYLNCTLPIVMSVWGKTNIVEVNLGTITSGRCAGDFLYCLNHWCQLPDHVLTKSAPIELTCNGYHYRQTPFSYTADFNGQKEVMGLADSNQIMSFVNANIVEVNLGTITSGRCAGDFLYVQTMYTNDIPLACVDYSLCRDAHRVYSQS
ncbi:unnamed protein product [Medioppia subpectinata]|uniref:Uncharacterized protein n=1 Tax=Medioppia subpectinata TaxID=1979941 RepID=A0A7R9KKR3_9ACAR|nr:unnamed protein product [Medioppia subpectinata]CAG2105401.1 unnamed protein product [Medioppia subpectinata]